MSKELRFDGKVAIVTGAGGGLGRTYALLLASRGAKVVVNDLGGGMKGGGSSARAADTVVGEIKQAGGEATANYDSVEFGEKIVKTAIDAYGRIDILINNAGLTRDNLAMRMKDEEWDQVLAVNLSAGFRLARASLRAMMKRRWGRIIGITSIVGVTGNPGQANYAASKAGMIGMSKALAQEVASRGITVNCIAPGFIETAMTDALGEAQQEKLLAAVPAGRLGVPADIAAAAVYLASEEAAYMTGQTLHVNGGMAMI
jgi:3-oxoacyl-[acyl-carrier protein] reductase